MHACTDESPVTRILFPSLTKPKESCDEKESSHQAGFWMPLQPNFFLTKVTVCPLHPGLSRLVSTVSFCCQRVRPPFSSWHGGSRAGLCAPFPGPAVPGLPAQAAEPPGEASGKRVRMRMNARFYYKSNAFHP